MYDVRTQRTVHLTREQEFPVTIGGEPRTATVVSLDHDRPGRVFIRAYRTYKNGTGHTQSTYTTEVEFGALPEPLQEALLDMRLVALEVVDRLARKAQGEMVAGKDARVKTLLDEVAHVVQTRMATHVKVQSLADQIAKVAAAEVATIVDNILLDEQVDATHGSGASTALNAAVADGSVFG